MANTNKEGKAGDTGNSELTDDTTAPPATGSSSNTTASVRTAKKIFLVKNGAMYSRPQRTVIPPRLVDKWDAIMQLLDEVCLIDGGVHRVVSAEDWKPAKTFADLEDGKLYVVLNNSETLQKFDYQGMANDTSRSCSPRRKAPEVPKPMKRAGPKVPSRWAEKDNHCRFRIFVNKSNIVRPFVVNLNLTEIQKFSDALQNKVCSPLEIVFKRIEQSCSLTLPENKPIRKMFTLEGRPLTDPCELTNDAAYVVAGNEAFVDLNYDARQLKSVIRHGPVAGKRDKYIWSFPSADKTRYAAQSRRAAEKQRSRKANSKSSEQTSENGDATPRSRDDRFEDNKTPRNGKTNGLHQKENGYDTPRRASFEEKEEIARFGEDGAPKLVETEEEGREQGRNATHNDNQATERTYDDRDESPTREDDAMTENGATTARQPKNDTGDYADDPRQSPAVGNK